MLLEFLLRVRSAELAEAFVSFVVKILSTLLASSSSLKEECIDSLNPDRLSHVRSVFLLQVKAARPGSTTLALLLANIALARVLWRLPISFSGILSTLQ